jgi:hypothetical protein
MEPYRMLAKETDTRELAAEGVKGSAWPVPSAVPLVLLLLLFFFLLLVVVVRALALVRVQAHALVPLSRPKISFLHARLATLTCLISASVEMIRMGIRKIENHTTLREKQMEMMPKRPQNRCLSVGLS